MSRGLEGYFLLLKADKDSALYGYSGDNFSFPEQYNQRLAQECDGRLRILLSPVPGEKPRVLLEKECRYAERNSQGQDILALLTFGKIWRLYQENGKFPIQGHWVV